MGNAARTITTRLRRAMRSSYRRYELLMENRRLERDGPEGIDPRITYPSYKSLDEFVDVDRLRSLDGFLREAAGLYLAARRGRQFETGELKKGLFSRATPGSTVIDLTEPVRSDQYFDLDNPDFWTPSESAAEFAPLLEFIDTLPLTPGRIIIMCDDRGRKVTPHRDHCHLDVLHEFVWFRTNLDKPFYVQDGRSKRRKYVASHTAWFDTANQYHGADATGQLAISVRVDGRFDDALRARIPEPPLNRASTPALWASLEP